MMDIVDFVQRFEGAAAQLLATVHAAKSVPLDAPIAPTSWGVVLPDGQIPAAATIGIAVVTAAARGRALGTVRSGSLLAHPADRCSVKA